MQKKKKLYIVETGRELKIRIFEHKRAIRTKIQDNGLAVHVDITKHKIQFDQVKILGRESDTQKRKIKEAYFFKHLNAQINLNNGVKISTWI